MDTITKIKCLLIFLMINVHSLNAATYTSVTSGNFNDPTTWGVGSIAGGTNSYIISSSHTVTLTAAASVTILTIQSGATFDNDIYKLSLLGGGNYYTNNGVHNGTGNLYFNNGTIIGVNGSGSINCNIEIGSGGPRFEISSSITVNADIMHTGGGDFELKNYGNLILNGNFTTNSTLSIIIVNAAGATIMQTGSVYLTAGVSIENSGSYTISGNLTLGDGGSYFWNFDGAVLILSGDLLGGGIGVSIFGQEANATAKFGGNVFPSGSDGDLLVSGVSPFFSTSTEPNTVEYYGTANQIIKNPVDNNGYGYTNNTYSNLVISNTAIKTLESSIVVNGNLSLSGTAQLDVSATNYSLDLYGNFTDASTNANPFVERSGTVSLVGTVAQTISSVVAGGQTFYNLTLNNTSTGVTLSNNGINISNVLTLTDGVLHTGTYECVVTNTALAAITNYSTTSYIDGNLRRSILAGGGNYNFPLGNTDSYQHAALNISAGHSVGTILGFFKNYAAGTTGLPLVESGNTYNSLLHCGGITPGTPNAMAGTWTFTPDAGTATYSLTLNARNYDYGDIGTNTIAKRANSGASWAILGTVGSSSGSDPFTVSRTAYSGFSEFAILTAIVPLPIELLTISAKCQKSKMSNSEYGATLQWTTATETNSDYFVIEGSKNGFDWQNLDTIDGSGTKYDPTNYYFHDDFINQTPENETVVYYRVSQTDFDGVVKTYDVLSCKCEASDKIKIHPVPSTESIVINFGDQNNVPNSFQITDMFGKIIQDVTVIGDKANNTSYKLDISNYSSGRYIIKINDWKTKEDAIFIKK